ncbi:hypothetical protein PSPO01_13914 [Paraphaeosphaeria sporulosa]
MAKLPVAACDESAMAGAAPPQALRARPVARTHGDEDRLSEERQEDDGFERCKIRVPELRSVLLEHGMHYRPRRKCLRLQRFTVNAIPAEIKRYRSALPKMSSWRLYEQLKPVASTTIGFFLPWPPLSHASARPQQRHRHR